MPELPDITIYVEAIQRQLAGHRIDEILVRSPFVMRTFDPEIADCASQTVKQISRLGKRVVWELSDDLFIVFHLMIAGRFHWKSNQARPNRKNDLALFRFEHGTMILTEASQKKRASIHVHRGREQLTQHHRSGLNVLTCSADEFRTRLTAGNRTLKKVLTDPSAFDGIGNAYSDEILHAAGLSPLQQTSRLSDDEADRLLASAISTIQRWTEKLRQQTGDGFPQKVTAFHPDMAVHGRFGQRCPTCHASVQRIVYKERELNYCPGCQTDGKILKDRSLSRLLKDDWPANLDE